MGKTIQFAKATPEQLVSLFMREKRDEEYPPGHLHELLLQFMAFCFHVVMVNTFLQEELSAKKLEKEPVATRAACKLLKMGEAAIPALGKGLESASWYQRAMSAIVLGEIGGDAAAQLLIAALEREPLGITERWILSAMGDTKSPLVIPVLLKQLELPWPVKGPKENLNPLQSLMLESVRLLHERTLLGQGSFALQVLRRFDDPRIPSALEVYKLRLDSPPDDWKEHRELETVRESLLKDSPLLAALV